MATQPSDFTKIYWVSSAPRGWRLERSGESLAMFTDPVEAVSTACGAAKSDADKGYVATVTVETNPREFQCYAPSTARASHDPASPPYLRLLG